MSAAGLLVRRRVGDGGSSEMKIGKGERVGGATEEEEVRRRREKEEREELVQSGEGVRGLNLLLSAYGEVEIGWIDGVEEEKGGLSEEERVRRQVELANRRREEDLPRIAGLLKRFADEVSSEEEGGGEVSVEGVGQPDHWTVAAILAFATPSTPSPVDSKYTQAQPFLVMWAWKALKPLFDTQAPFNSSTTIGLLHSFLSFVASPATSFQTTNAILYGISNLIHQSSTPPPSSLVAHLVQTIIQRRQPTLLPSLLPLLTPSQAFPLSLQALNLVSTHKDWHKTHELILPLSDTFLSSATSLSLSHSTPLPPDYFKTLQKGINYLLNSFGISRPLESHLHSLSLLLLLSPSPPLPLLINLLKHLTTSRNPSLALSLLNKLPPDLLTMEMFIAALSSSHAKTSDKAWEGLVRWSREKGEKVPLRAYKERLKSHLKAPLNGEERRRARGKAEREVAFGRREGVFCATAEEGREMVERVEGLLREVRERGGARKDLRLVWGGESWVGERGRVERGWRKGGLKGVGEELRRVGRRKGEGRGDMGMENFVVGLVRRESGVGVEALREVLRGRLGVDLSAEEEVGEGEVVEGMTRKEWEKERRPAFRTLMRGFRERGERGLERRLGERMREELWVVRRGEMEREEVDE